MPASIIIHQSNTNSDNVMLLLQSGNVWVSSKVHTNSVEKRNKFINSTRLGVINLLNTGNKLFNWTITQKNIKQNGMQTQMTECKYTQKSPFYVFLCVCVCVSFWFGYKCYIFLCIVYANSSLYFCVVSLI